MNGTIHIYYRHRPSQCIYAVLSVPSRFLRQRWSWCDYWRNRTLSKGWRSIITGLSVRRMHESVHFSRKLAPMCYVGCTSDRTVEILSHWQGRNFTLPKGRVPLRPPSSPDPNLTFCFWLSNIAEISTGGVSRAKYVRVKISARNIESTSRYLKMKGQQWASALLKCFHHFNC